MASPVACQVNRTEILREADIVIVGTVTEMGAASFPAVPVTERTLIARVDAILEKPEAVALAEGDAVTVEVKDSSGFESGAQFVFYAQGWILGEGVAIREIGHEMLVIDGQAVTFGQADSTVMNIREELRDSRIQDRTRAADAVFVGRVVAVGPSTMSEVGAPLGSISEHDPAWQEAIIEVEAPIKGSSANQRIVVRFPSSMDVAWTDAPKFKVGQEGTFILQKDQVSGTDKALLAGVEVEAYTAIRSIDVLDRDEEQRVRALITQAPR
jgi:hypothetical protein